MAIDAEPNRDNLVASKNSSDFDYDFRERARVLLDNRDAGVSLLSCSISTPVSNLSSKETSTDMVNADSSVESKRSQNTTLPASSSTSAIEHAKSLSRQCPSMIRTKPPTNPTDAQSNVAAPTIASIKLSVNRRRRLPWLDRTRQSIPRTTTGPMPGSYGDEISSRTSLNSSGSAMSEEELSKLPAASRASLARVGSVSPASIPQVQYQQLAEEPIMRGVPFHSTPVPVHPVRVPARSIEAQYEYSNGSHLKTNMKDIIQDSMPTGKPTGIYTPWSAQSDNQRRGILKRPTEVSTQSCSVPELPIVLSPTDPVQHMNQLMDQAVSLAADAACQGKIAELTGIIDEVNTAAHHANAINLSQRVLADKRLSDSDHTSTYSSISSSSEGEFPRNTRHIVGARRASDDLSSQMATSPEEVITRDWAYPGVVCMKRTHEERRRRRTVHDIPIFRSNSSPSANSESQQSLLTHASPTIKDQFEPAARQPMGYEGPDSPFDKSPPGDRHSDQSAEPSTTIRPISWGRDKYDEKDYVSTDSLKGQRHVTLREGQRWSIHHHRRQPIARNWSIRRKRLAALVTCLNTALIGMIIGIYAGEVPAIQFRLTDEHHYVNLGNVVLYLGMMVSTFVFWPLPLLHGRKPYTITALAVVLPLHFPQALMVADTRNPNLARYRIGLLLPRAFIGLALGFVHINLFNTLLDLFGASLQSEFPHGEVVILEDVRRHGGGMGLWLGCWSACFIGSLSVGFFVGAEIISGLDVTWGFYISVVVVAIVLLLDIMTPETRRSPHRRTMREVQLRNMNVERRVGRGEVKIHVDGEGPLHWWEEVGAGITLSLKMFDQVGFFLLSSYLAWVYAQVWLIIVLLGNLLSTEYRWRPEYIGTGALSVAIGATLAIPLSRANLFSRSREKGPRTDSMTFQPRLTWTSHLLRRTAFMTVLPLAGMAYTLGSAGRNVHYMVPIAFACLVGFVSNLAVAECHGIIMETFDTSDLQPGVNSRHRLQSLAVSDAKRRTSYSSYPRVSAGLAVAHSLGFGLAAAATAVSGALTRAVGAQKATGIVAGILAVFTVLLMLALVRYKSMQVIPNELFGQGFGSGDNERKGSVASNKSWRAVIIGNPSGKHRRMSLLELGGLSRWTEIRRLNRLLNRTTTQGLQPGWR